jgi:hypothetical protein
MSPTLAIYQAWLATLHASQTDLAPSTQAGITTGPGNQGTANTAHLSGQAGTAANQVPRTLQF